VPGIRTRAQLAVAEDPPETAEAIAA
jgi:hypothetical protein